MMPFTKQHSAYAWVVTCILFLINLTFHNLPLHSSYKIHQPITDYFLRLPYSELLEKRLFRSRANRRLVACSSRFSDAHRHNQMEFSLERWDIEGLIWKMLKAAPDMFFHDIPVLVSQLDYLDYGVGHLMEFAFTTCLVENYTILHRLANLKQLFQSP